MEGVALARNGNTMRVALRGHNDAIELFEVKRVLAHGKLGTGSRPDG